MRLQINYTLRQCFRKTAMLVSSSPRSFLLFGSVLISCVSLRAQDYLQKLVNADQYFGQQIAQFTNGDVLVGNASIEALRTGDGGTLYLTRLDVCGNVSWSRAYHREEEYLEIKDLLINEQDEIFAYGSAYIGLDELIFLFKVDSEGKVMKFQLFEPETVDHFSYSIDLRNGLLLAYGLILDFNTKKFGFVSAFDENLNFQWGVKFTPFESTGDAIVTSNGGFLCRSGPYLIQLTPGGEWDWGHTLVNTPQHTLVGGPFDTGDGYILQAYAENYSRFYKVGTDGKLVWTSERFPSRSLGADLAVLANGQIIASYSSVSGNEPQLCYLILSQEGKILERHALQTNSSLNPGQTHLSAARSDRVVIAVDVDHFNPGTTSLPTFLLQTSWPTVTNECFVWKRLPESELLTDAPDLQFSSLDTITTPTNLRPAGSTLISTLEFLAPYQQMCQEDPAPDLVLIDSLLECGQDWQVSLPGPDFVWADGYPEFSRLLSQPGSYQARNESCGELSLYEYELIRESCPCAVYLPNAFSPNGDGLNDLLEVYSSCELDDVRMRVFNRWGTMIFNRQHPGLSWDGSSRGQAVASGIYLVLIDYYWRDLNGELQHGMIRQELTLIR